MISKQFIFAPVCFCLLALPGLVSAGAPASTSGSALEPFAVAVPKNPSKQPKPMVLPQFQKTLDCFGAKNASAWIAGGLSVPASAKLFTLDESGGKEALHLYPGAFDAGQTVLGFRLPEEVVAAMPNYVSFLCKSSKGPLRLNFHLLTTAAIDGAGAKVVVPVNAGEWQRVVIPFARFGFKGTPKYHALGFSVDVANGDSEAFIADIGFGSTPVAPVTLKSQRTVIAIKGDWHFAPDPDNQGLAKKWNAPDFDDSAWQSLKTGESWLDQGIVLAGWGWYRQKIVIPREPQGAPLTIVLAELPFDDDVYFNGVRIGGIVGNYPYYNFRLRTYSVPPDAVHYGEANTIAVRTWGGGGITKAGMIGGLDPKGAYYEAQLDPYAPRMYSAATNNEEQMPDHFDMSGAQQGMPFGVAFRFPADVMKSGSATLYYTLTDYYGDPICTGHAAVEAGKDGLARAAVNIDGATAQTIYLRGRFKAWLAVCDSSGTPVATDARDLDRFSFASRDKKELPALPIAMEETPYGKLKLVDEIDCSLPADKDPHPYMQGGFNHAADRMTPGSKIDMSFPEILGRKARENGCGFFAYRIGRGKLKIHSTYLLRVEYPEDKPRYCPMEIQNGHDFIDIGWKNGVSADDPYDNWPLSRAWQWYDAVVSLDEETVGTEGTGSASAEDGVWVYFINKRKPGRYFTQYDGGPAIGRMKLYEIDPEKNAPAIRYPKDQPRRTLMLDWERQADQPPEDIVRYCKLMGYNTVSPIMLKWGFMNFGEPLSGYDTTTLDALRYWVRTPFKNSGESEAPNGDAATSTETPAAEADDSADASESGATSPGKKNRKAKAAAVTTSAAARPSIHAQYLAATKKYGIDYVPRIEYGGSLDLPPNARAVGGDGEVAKPDRFAQWGADLLNPATWPDLSRTVDNYFKPYIKDNPQLTGMLWRIRSDRMQISYSHDDIAAFARETHVKLPDLPARDLAAWASTGDVERSYVDWWQAKREEFHAKLVSLLKSYRPDMTLYYFNWDADKWALGLRDFFTASTFVEVGTARIGLVPEVYKKHVRQQNAWTGSDYVQMIRTGQINDWTGWGPDYGLHTELYKDLAGMQLFAPVSARYMADNATYLNYFKTRDGLAVSNAVSYDEGGSRSINPKYECNMVTPGGAAFSMALEVLSCFHGDPRTITYTVYTYGRGYADAHRRFAQAFLALPATEGSVVETADKDLRVRAYPAGASTYIGVVYKGCAAKKLDIHLPGNWKAGTKVRNLVTDAVIPATITRDGLEFTLESGPMELNAFLAQ